MSWFDWIPLPDLPPRTPLAPKDKLRWWAMVALVAIGVFIFILGLKASGASI